MNDRETFFNRPTPDERSAARKAQRAAAERREQDEWEHKVREAHEARKAELDRLLKENDPGPWWRRG
jgi:hypothetical protein